MPTLAFPSVNRSTDSTREASSLESLPTETVERGIIRMLVCKLDESMIYVIVTCCLSRVNSNLIVYFTSYDS